jgi:LuxR family quorum sensing-dependent transcriptional regulator
MESNSCWHTRLLPNAAGVRMANTAQAFGQEALDFIEDLDRLSSADAVAEAMIGVVARFGFEGLIIAGLRPEPGQGFEDLVLAAKCPADFRAVYESRDYIRFDPNVRRALRSIHPFEWSTSDYGEEAGPRVAEIMRFLADFGYLRGFVVPIRGPFGYEAGVWMAGAKLDLTTKTKPSIHLMALYAFERLRQLALAEFEEKPPLTGREREVLAWSAEGKSASEIGEILSVAKRTVDEHTQTAMRKLGAANRTQAVAIAIRHRLFEI